MQKFWQDKKTHLYIWEVTNVFFLHFFFTKLFQKVGVSLGVITIFLPLWWCQDKTKCKPYLFPSSLWSDEPVEQVQVDLLAKDARDVLEAGPEIKYCHCLRWKISEWRLLSYCLLKCVSNLSIFACDVHTSTITTNTLAEIHHPFSCILITPTCLKTKAPIYYKLFLAKKNFYANNTTK